jgi:hypothetical protein
MSKLENLTDVSLIDLLMQVTSVSLQKSWGISPGFSTN